MTRKVPSHSCFPALVKPRYSILAGLCLRLFKLRAYGKLTVTSVTLSSGLTGVHYKTRTGKWLASGWPMEALELAVVRTCPWLSLRSSALVFGLALTSTISTEASCGQTLSPLLLTPFFPDASIYGSSCTPFQTSLSARTEAKTCHHLLAHSSHECHRVAQFCLNRIPGAGAWLFALPDSLESRILAPPFRASRRLRMPMWSQDTNCTL